MSRRHFVKRLCRERTCASLPHLFVPVDFRRLLVKVSPHFLLFTPSGTCLLPLLISAKPEDFYIAPVQGAAPSRTTAVAHPCADLPDFTTHCPAAAGIVEDYTTFFIPGIKTKSIATDTDGLSSVSGDSAPAPVPAYPHHLSSVRPPTIQSLPTPLKALSISQSQGVGASGDAATKSEDPHVPPRGRGSTMRRNPDVVPRPITPRPATPRPATPRPATPKPTTAPKDEASSTVVPSEYPNSQQPVACLSKPLLSPEAQGFCVAQGRAEPKKARTVSRVQRIINARVRDRWGYPMPYAPEWVYDEVEKNLEEWLYGELLKKTDVGPKGLFQSDPQMRQRDMVFLCDTLSEWWYGRTILKHHVKSCGKFQEDRFFSLSSTLPNGGKVEKPHPSYYLSYEHTLEKYGVNV
ncbi:hypothetical protein XELAEV_18008684mg [Xenopus laevis]|uniref:Uncharacterized protein n=1 Tax=Xenopus laevis TaxID=8355 RepID=A0A974DR54_XENLA|nr:hypothetical protein XELAEV_18008684mg [Xenopus laevis]